MRASEYREALAQILSVNATLVAQRQNEEMKTLSETSIAQGEEVKKISAWAAILFAPSLVGGVYGMNFEHMPEIDWLYSYPAWWAIILLISALLYRALRRNGWL